MKPAVRGLVSVSGICLLVACASTETTVGDGTPRPAARPVKRVSAPPPSKRDVHSNCGDVAPPRIVTDPYDASKLSVLSKVMFYTRENYVDPRRLAWNRALLGALTALPQVASEVSVDTGGDALPAAVKVAVGDHECRVPISSISEPWEMRSALQEVMKLLQGSLPPLAAEPAGRRLLNLEIAATNGMLATFDADSVLIEPPLVPTSPNRNARPAAGSGSFAAPGQVLVGARRVGYLRLSRLDADAAAGVSAALGDFAREGVMGIVVDLRGNTGGLFDQAGKVVDAFARRGPIVSLVAKGERRVTEARADGTEPTVPILVVTDHETSSGGAIVAAGLHDLSGAILIGAPTNASTSIQMLFDLSSPLDVLQRAPKLVLKLTIGHWVRAGDRSLEGKGVVPDVAIDPRVLALEGPDGSRASSPAIAAARDALITAATADRAAIITAAQAAVRAAESKALPSLKI